MSFISLLFQLVFIYVIIRVLWSVFRGKRKPQEPVNDGKKQQRRFDVKGKDVADADFEEIKGKK
jgi:hypothetical protein